MNAFLKERVAGRGSEFSAQDRQHVSTKRIGRVRGPHGAEH